MKNNRNIKLIIISFIFISCFMTFQRMTAQDWGGGAGHSYDRWTVNDDNTNHWSYLRLQVANAHAWNMVNQGDLWWGYAANGTHADRGTKKMTLTTTGKLGIGDHDPTAALHVKADGDQLIVEPATSNGNDAVIKIIGHRNENTNDNASQLLFQNFDHDPSTNTHSLGMIAGKITNHVANVGDLVFYNYANGNNAKESMRLTSSGHVGIGTETPDNAQGWGKVLDVHNNVHTKILATTTTADVKTGIFSHSNWAGNFGPMGVVGTESNHDLTLMAGYGAHHVTIKTGGDVGIGTTTPSAKLDVDGTGHFSGNVGIGTINPSANLHVNGTGRFDGTAYFDDNVGIGITNPVEKFEVSGNVKADGVILNIGSFPDYVFGNDYPLMPLEKVESYIKANKHLPGFPSESEVIKDGANLGRLNNLLVEKVEELTLHTIAQEKQIDKLSDELMSLKAQISELLKKQ